MMKQSKRGIVICIMVTMLFVTACGNKGGSIDHNTSSQLKKSYIIKSNPTPKVFNETQPNQTEAIIATLDKDGTKYIPLHELIDVLEFHDEWDAEAQTHYIGDNDIIYAIKINDKQAEKEEEIVSLPQAPIVLDGMTYISEASFTQLFQDDVKHKFVNQQLIIYAPDYDAEEEDLEFADDPEDRAISAEEAWREFSADEESIAVLKKVNRQNIVTTGRKYLGVKYKFGAKPYATSKRFDCSSFTQHVFGKYGISLRRVARNQAKQGVAVSRKSLRTGDLLFFYIPGRFKSNKVIGHVGIYMGNNRMIHAGTSPKNGVQITNINSAYWKKTFIKARRVVA